MIKRESALKDNPWKAGSRKNNDLQLNLQKSGFIPKTISTTGGHDIVNSHMKSHYNRITSAKSRTDTSAPKSLTANPRRRDYKGNATQNITSGLYTGRPQSARSIKGRHSVSNSRPVSARTAPEEYDVKRKAFRKNANSTILLDASHPGTRMANTSSILDYNDSPAPEATNEQDKTADEPSQDKLAEYLILKYGAKSKSKNKQKNYKDKQQQDSSNNIQNVPSRNNLQSNDNNANEITKTALANYNFQDGSAKRPENLRSNVDNWLSDANKSLMAEVNLEMEYLKFMSALTNDIVCRGIFSDRYINRIIDQHIRDNRAILNEDHMHELADQLRKDLCIRD